MTKKLRLFQSSVIWETCKLRKSWDEVLLDDEKVRMDTADP